MNVDADMQYAFTRGVAGYMFKNYDGVLKIDGEPMPGARFSRSRR